MLRFKALQSNIFAVEGSTPPEVARLFLRFQEHYESPKFRNKVFTLDQFKKWYRVSRKEKTFTYYTDWVGFNVPGFIFKRFFIGDFGKLSTKEKWLMSQIIKKVDISKPYFILGYKKGSLEVLEHEMAHAKFYSSAEYRAKVLGVLRSIRDLRSFKKLQKYMIDSGYHKNVILDECHAYLLCEEKLLKKEKLWDDKFAKITKRLRKIFETF